MPPNRIVLLADIVEHERTVRLIRGLVEERAATTVDATRQTALDRHIRLGERHFRRLGKNNRNPTSRTTTATVR